MKTELNLTGLKTQVDYTVDTRAKYNGEITNEGIFGEKKEWVIGYGFCDNGRSL